MHYLQHLAVQESRSFLFKVSAIYVFL
jgi:hypothetical protein